MYPRNPRQRAYAYEQDALMDTIKMEDFEPEPDRYQDDLTRARELLREVAGKYKGSDLAARISDFLKGEGG